MLAVTLKYNSCCSLNTIIFKNCIKVWQIFCCIIREDHCFSTTFKIIDNGIFFIFWDICRWRINKQTICIIRNTAFCKKIQWLNIHVCFFDVFFDRRIHLFFSMSFQCIKNRKIFRSYISDSTCDLTFTIKTSCLITVCLIIHCTFIDIVIINNFVSISAYHNKTICRKIIACILGYKFRIYYRVFLFYFNMFGFIFIFLKKIRDIFIFWTALCNLINRYILIQIFQHCLSIVADTVKLLTADIDLWVFGWNRTYNHIYHNYNCNKYYWHYHCIGTVFNMFLADSSNQFLFIKLRMFTVFHFFFQLHFLSPPH